MLAARDQENLVLGHRAGGAKQHKTPGAQFPKTPLKVPLNDENATRLLGGKSALGQRTKGGNENILTVSKAGPAMQKSSLVTPLETRTARAPLGNKTTNAKARTGQTGGVKDRVQELEKTQLKPTTTKKLQQKSPQKSSGKLEIHSGESENLDEEDIEYAPPKPKDLPYESDVFPDGILTFEGLKPENLFKGYYDYYYNPVDDNGVPLKERQLEEERRKALQEGEKRIFKDMEEFDWTVGDVPESATFFQKASSGDPTKLPVKADKTKPIGRVTSRPPLTIASRKAASALSIPPKPTGANAHKTTQPVPAPRKTPGYLLPRKTAQMPALKTSAGDSAMSVAASRSTIGYNKGRSASSMVHGRAKPESLRPGLTRSNSTLSTASDATITPARYARRKAAKNEEEEANKKLEFLSIFEADEEDGNICGPAALSSLSFDDDMDDDFQLTPTF